MDGEYSGPSLSAHARVVDASSGNLLSPLKQNRTAQAFPFGFATDSGESFSIAHLRLVSEALRL